MKTAVLLFSAYFLIIFQANFLFFFGVNRYLPNIAIILILLVIFLESDQSRKGLVLAAVSGLLLDFFLVKPIGFYGLIFLTGAILVKSVMKRRFRLKIKEN